MWSRMKVLPVFLAKFQVICISSKHAASNYTKHLYPTFGFSLIFVEICQFQLKYDLDMFHQELQRRRPWSSIQFTKFLLGKIYA